MTVTSNSLLEDAYDTFCGLVLWENLWTSSTFFFSGLMFLLLVDWGQYSVLTLLSYLALLHLIGTGVYISTIDAWARWHEPSVLIRRRENDQGERYIEAEDVVAHIHRFVEAINTILAIIYRIYKLKDFLLFLRVSLAVLVTF